MKVKGVRLYAKDDIRLEEFELPEIKDDEILVKVMSDSICFFVSALLLMIRKNKYAPRIEITNVIQYISCFSTTPN